jgi:hypothetical protein
MVGTAFFVSPDGHALTARHLVEQRDAIRLMGGRDAVLEAGIPILSPELRNRFVPVSFEILDEDAPNDLLLGRVVPNPLAPQEGHLSLEGRPVRTLCRSVRFCNHSVRDGDAISLTGFPLQLPVPVTMSGAIATAAAFDEDLGARGPGGGPLLRERFWADLEAHPCSSGAPAYSVHDGGVIGVCIAGRLLDVCDQREQPVHLDVRPSADYMDGRRQLLQSAGLTVITPVRFALDLLNRHRVTPRFCRSRRS